MSSPPQMRHGLAQPAREVGAMESTSLHLGRAHHETRASLRIDLLLRANCALTNAITWGARPRAFPDVALDQQVAGAGRDSGTASGAARNCFQTFIVESSSSISRTANLRVSKSQAVVFCLTSLRRWVIQRSNPNAYSSDMLLPPQCRHCVAMLPDPKIGSGTGTAVICSVA